MSTRRILSEDDEEFVSELRQNALFKREEAFMNLNSELEKKTSAILEQIEKYTAVRKSQSRQTFNETSEEAGGGDGDGGGGGDSVKLTGISENSKTPESHVQNNTLSHQKSKQLLYNKSFVEGDFRIRRVPSALSVKSVSSLKSGRKLTRTRTFSDIGAESCESLAFDDTFFLDSTLEKGDEGDGEKRQKARIQKAKDSVITCLQSKLGNYETRIKELHLQYRQKIQENTILETRIKALEEDRDRLLRSVTSLQSSLDKQIKQVDLCKSTSTSKAHVVETLRKEIESLKREKKQSHTQVQSLLTRLNRTTEENEKLKGQVKSVNIHLREVQAEHRAKTEDQGHRIVTLEQERSMLSSTVAKQAHLLKNLSQQKVILENIINRSNALANKALVTDNLVLSEKVKEMIADENEVMKAPVT